MTLFQFGTLALNVLDEGEGKPIVLVHGFGSNVDTNWVATGWVDALKRAGRRVIAFDNRGHGASSKLYTPEAYTPETMANDVAMVMDRLGVQQADVMGYSMGGRISAFLALQAPKRLDRLIMGGIGKQLVIHPGVPEVVADAMLADTLAEVTDPLGRTFRKFVDGTRGDRMALAACIRGSRRIMTPEQLQRIHQPTLIAVGTLDDIAGSGPELAAMLPNARAVDIPGKEHNPAVGDKTFKEAVLAFLG